MERQNFFRAFLCISTLIFMLWYFLLYPWTEEYVAQYEKALNVCIKNCSRTNKLQFSCKLEQQSVDALNNQCQRCVEPLQNNIDDTSIMQALIKLFETHNLILTHYKQMTKEKKEWYTIYTAAVHFQGLLADILMFFKALSENHYGIIPLKVNLNTDAHAVTHVAVTVSWVLSKK